MMGKIQKMKGKLNKKHNTENQRDVQHGRTPLKN